MGIYVGLLIGILILVVRRVRASRGGPRQKMTRARWINLGWYAGALAVIIACEVVLPSTVLTGKDRPAIVEPPRPLDDIEWSAQKISYDMLARSTPWAWNLGYLTRDEMQRRIDDDISLASADLKDLLQQIKDLVVEQVRVVLNQRQDQTLLPS